MPEFTQNAQQVLKDGQHFADTHSPEAAAEIVRAMQAVDPAHMIDDAHYAMPAHGWTCFHCGDTFKTPGSARLHFGADPMKDPACQIKTLEERGLLMALRKVEGELETYRTEDTELHRQIHAMSSDHSQALIREEERGYAKGLHDGRHETSDQIATYLDAQADKRPRRRQFTQGIRFAAQEVRAGMYERDEEENHERAA